MRRREFISLFGGAAASWPLAARAQQPAMRLVGYLNPVFPGAYAPYLAAFRQGLEEAGFIVGRNVAIEYRWAEGEYDRLPALAVELVEAQVAVIAASGGTVSARAAKAATTTIPIVFNSGDDPVASGLVTSINRPGGNITGVSAIANQLTAKRLELLHQLVPNVNVIATLFNPTNSTTEPQSRDAQEAARKLRSDACYP
jgi:putative ABC transport system substrate-binding protein